MKKPITNKVLWIFAVGQFGWSLLAGLISNWLVFYYTGEGILYRPQDNIEKEFNFGNLFISI